MKVIESNGRCRELLKNIRKESDDDKNVSSSQESIEKLQKIGKVKTSKRFDDQISQNPASVLKVEVEEYDNFHDNNDFVDNYNENESKMNISKVDDTLTCGICAETLLEKTPLTNFTSTLTKILPIELHESGFICSNCVQLTKSAEKLLEIRQNVINVKREYENLGDDCQFCLINDVFSTRTPKYLVHKYNLMPLCRDSDSNKLIPDAKSCKECMKLLKNVYSILCLYTKRQKMMENVEKSCKAEKPRKSESNKRKNIIFKKEKSKKKKKSREFMIKTENSSD